MTARETIIGLGTLVALIAAGADNAGAATPPQPSRSLQMTIMGDGGATARPARVTGGVSGAKKVVEVGPPLSPTRAQANRDAI